jgi:glycerol-3-phosphate dehydrogenase (NAD(P)+)
MGFPVAVIGGGSFGTCLAMLCARENDVTLWCRSADMAEQINHDRRNPRYLKGATLPESVHATANLEEALKGKELVLLAVPSHSLREVISKAQPYLSEGAILVSGVKGIEYETGMTMHHVLEDVLEEAYHPRIVCLSGPSFAREIAERKPTVVTLACREESYAVSVQATLSCPLKNVVAIAVGIGDGMQQGYNSRAAMMTRGLAEVTRLGVKMGAESTTFLGLSGMGDLLLTCTSDLSRNRRVGLALGQGRNLDDILEEMGEVAEGVHTTRAACRLAKRLGVELPIADLVCEVIDGHCSPREAGERLMGRQLRSEREEEAER